MVQDRMNAHYKKLSKAKGKLIFSHDIGYYFLQENTENQNYEEILK